VFADTFTQKFKPARKVEKRGSSSLHYDTGVVGGVDDL
jgi:hypothetical protein